MFSKSDTNQLNLIYILGLSHSGSTLLDLLLSRHPGLVGLGEVNFFLNNKKRAFEGTEATCGCGAFMNSCPFWSVAGKQAGEYSTRYKHIIDRVQQYGAGGCIDSSKKWEPLADILPLARAGRIHLSVLYLVRDARGWAHSMARVDRRQGRYRPTLYYLYLWYRGNRRLLRRARDAGITLLSISYEELCARPDETLVKIFDFTGLSSGGLGAADTHIAYGNRMKLSAGGAPRIRYDDAWQHNWSARFSLLLLPHVIFLNRKLVWSTKT